MGTLGFLLGLLAGFSLTFLALVVMHAPRDED